MRAMAYAGTILIGYFAMKSELPPPPSRTQWGFKTGHGERKNDVKQNRSETFFPPKKRPTFLKKSPTFF